MSISVRLLQAGDEERRDAFLKPHTPFVYFMRSNLKKGGLDYQGKPYQADFFGIFDGENLQGILSHSWLGNLQMWVHDKADIAPLVVEWRKHNATAMRLVVGILGVAEQVDTLLDVLRILPSMLRGGGAREENLFALALDKIEHDLHSDWIVRPAHIKDIEQLTLWRHDYNVEALGECAGQALYDKGKAEMLRRIDERDLFVLEHQGELVSFCGVGGYLPDWKMVGPVWTPPDKRNLGYARAVTTGSLFAVREDGATHAVLFANTAPAEKAYRAIGFDRIGRWRLDFLLEPSACL